MHPLEKKFYALVQKEGLVQTGDTVVVGFSGGPDSTALLYLLTGLQSIISIRLVAVHVNHGLRPALETTAEEEFVVNVCRRLGIEIVVRRLRVERLARVQRTGIEDAARTCRHAALRETAKRVGATRIALGHTADDQAEELLLRLLRGCGRSGLAGMALIHEGTLIRPLLSFRKQELLAFLDDRNIPWCQDSSNTDLRFLRNRIRHDLLPRLAADYNPNITETLVRTAAILRDEEALLAQLTDAAAKDILQKRPQEKDTRILDIRQLRSVPPAIGRRVVERALIEVGCPPRFEYVEAIRTLADKPAGKRLHLPRGLRVFREQDAIILRRPLGRCRKRGDL